MISLFACLALYANDGDGIRCQDGTRIRLAGIDAPEISQCRKGRQCVSGDAQASKASLDGMVRGRTLQCRSVGRSYNRVVAFCSIGAGLDLSCAQVRRGYAVLRYVNADRVCRADIGEMRR